MKIDQFPIDNIHFPSFFILKKYISAYKILYLQGIEHKDHIVVDWGEETCLKFSIYRHHRRIDLNLVLLKQKLLGIVK